MQISVSGKHMAVGSSLSSYIEKTLSEAIHKFFGKELNAQVILEKDSPFFKTEILIHSSPLMKGESQDDDAYRSFYNALKKIENQFRKKHSKTKQQHHHDQKEVMYKFYTEENTIEEAEGPAIIAETHRQLKKMSVADAAEYLQAEKNGFWTFINSHNDKNTVVYKREDGNIGWIEYTA
jgi:ribosomal subunit interface protein